MEGGEFNMGFSPTSPRASIPLPDVPGLNLAESSHRYDVPNDLNSRVSVTTFSAASSSVRTTSPSLTFPGREGVGEQRAQTYHDEGEGWQRGPSRHQFHFSPQLEEQRRQLELLQREHGSPPSPQRIATNANDRPRARSVPRIDRPNTLSLQGQTRETPRGSGQGTLGGRDAGSRPTVRPRSNSHDAAFRVRLGALSDDDQRLLMTYLSAARQQSPLRSPERRRTVVTAADVERAPTPSQRRLYSPVFPRSRMPQTDDASAPSPNIIFENPPSFCSFTASVDTALSRDPSLLYLHPISSEADMYLQLLPDAQEHSPPTLSEAGSPHGQVILLPANLAPCQEVVSMASTQGTFTTSSAGLRNPVTSPMTPMASVRGSTTSDSSGAVFVSPDQEYSPPRYSVSATSAHSPYSKRAGTGVTDEAACSGPQFSPLSGQQANAVRVEGSNVKPSGRPLEQNRVLSSDRLQQLIVRHNNDTRRKSSPSEETVVEPRAPNASGFPGVVMRDSAGVLYFLPHFAAPLQSRLQPAHAAPAASGPVYPAPCPVSPASPPTRPGAGSSGQRTLSARDTAGSHPDTSSPAGEAPGSSLVPRAACTSQAGDTRRPAHFSDRAGLDAVRSSREQTLAGETRTARMGVDSLSSSRKPAENAIASKADENAERKLSNSTAADGEGCGPASAAETTFTGSSARDGSPKTSTGDCPKTPSGSGPRTENSEGVSAPPAPLIGVESLPYIQGYQLVPAPAPCRAAIAADTSSCTASNHTSGDSGNGEDLTTEAENDVVTVTL